MQLKFNIRKLEQAQAYLKTVPRGSVKAALGAIKDYFLGNERHGLKHYEPYKYVSRAKAYGARAWTKKQLRWFWANGGPDMIGNHRSGKTADAWQFKSTNGGYGMSLENKAEGAKWIWSDGQARQPQMVGHRTAADKIASNMSGAIRHARAAVRAFLAKR